MENLTVPPCHMIAQRRDGPRVPPCHMITQRRDGSRVPPCHMIAQRRDGPRVSPCHMIAQRKDEPRFCDGATFLRTNDSVVHKRKKTMEEQLEQFREMKTFIF